MAQTPTQNISVDDFTIEKFKKLLERYCRSQCMGQVERVGEQRKTIEALTEKNEDLQEAVVFVAKKFQEVEKGLKDEKERFEHFRDQDTKTKIREAFQSVLSSIDHLTQAKEDVRGKIETIFREKPLLSAIESSEEEVARLKSSEPFPYSKAASKKKRRTFSKLKKIERDNQFLDQQKTKDLYQKDLRRFEAHVEQLGKNDSSDREDEDDSEERHTINDFSPRNAIETRILAGDPNIQVWQEYLTDKGVNFVNKKNGDQQSKPPGATPSKDLILWELVKDDHENIIPNWVMVKLPDESIGYWNIKTDELWEKNGGLDFYYSPKGEFTLDTSFLKGGRAPQKILPSTKWIPSTRTRIKCRERSTFTKRRSKQLPTSKPQSSTTTNRSFLKLTKSLKQTRKARRTEKRRGSSTVKGRPTSSSTPS